MENSTDDKGNQLRSVMDSDWDHDGELAGMVQLAVAQIERALQEGDESLDTLSQFFSSMVGSVQKISQELAELNEGADLRHVKDRMQENCQLVKTRMNTVIVAFQFYDRLSQRLGHVCGSLGSLARLLDASAYPSNPDALRDLKEQVKNEFSLEEEQVLFDALQDGCSVREALNRCAEIKQAKGANNDIELF
jgi:hypothetical protein